MSWLKRLPIHYSGELHDVRLINFSVVREEISPKLPASIKLRDFNGRAMISMVDVKLKNMHPVAFPWVRFNYRHVAFRVLVDDGRYNGGVCKGIFFLKSFSDKTLIVVGGNVMTDYNLEAASIAEQNGMVTITQNERYVKYGLDDSEPEEQPVLRNTIGALDRAYSVLRGNLRVTEIQREKWPIRDVNCEVFKNTFFKTARFEGAFRVFETIYYEWLSPKVI